MGVLAGLVSTEFYPSTMTPKSSVNISTGSTRNPDVPAAYGGLPGENGNLPVLWWVGIIIVLVALRVAYEYL